MPVNFTVDELSSNFFKHVGVTFQNMIIRTCFEPRFFFAFFSSVSNICIFIYLLLLGGGGGDNAIFLISYSLLCNGICSIKIKICVKKLK